MRRVAGHGGALARQGAVAVCRDVTLLALGG